MIYPIRYQKRQVIVVNDIENYLFYFLDFDERSSDENMVFEHFHTFYEIHVLLSPNAVHFIEGVPYPIQANDFVLLRPSLLHKSCYPEGEPSRRLIINFMFRKDGYGFREAYEKLLEPFRRPLPIYRFDEAQQNILAGLVNRMAELSAQAGSEALTGMYELTLHSLFNELLYELNRFADSNLYTKNQMDNRVSERIYSVSNYIHTHYMEDLTLEKLAKEAWMSPHYLSHQFRRITGYTIMEYIHEVRIRNCQYQLINGKDKITDIASACGFSSFSQFNRVFRSLCGESPSEYRKRRIPGGNE